MTNLSRRVTGLLALCVLLLSGEADALGVHACPHHTRIGASSAAPAPHQAGAHHGSPPAPAHGDHQGCDCATGCPAASLDLLPAGAIPLPASISLAAPRAGRPAADVPARRAEPYVLPYGQGPPLG